MSDCLRIQAYGLTNLGHRPFGISFAGAALSEATLIRVAHVFEQATQQRRKCMTYPEATPTTQLKDVI